MQGHSAVAHPFGNIQRGRGRDLMVSAGMVLFLIATNRYFHPDIAIAELNQHDISTYRAIAEAAPSLPEGDFQTHHAQRFVPPYVIGLIARATSLEHELVARIAIAVLTIGTGYVVARSLRRVGADPPLQTIVLGFVLLHAAAFRYYIAFPYMLVDITFVAGIAAAIGGLLAGRTAPLLGGWILAAVSRQTALFLLPVVLLWLLIGSPWREMARTRRAMLGAALTGILVTAFVGAQTVAQLFAAPTDFGAVAFGLFRYLAAWPPGAAMALADLAFRPVATFLPFAAFVWQYPQKTAARRRLGSLLLFAVLAIIAQPLAAGPAVNVGNHVRLGNLALVPLALGATSFLGHAQLRGRTLVQIGALVAIASFHHRWTAAGAWVLGQPAALLLLQAAVAAAIGLLLASERQRAVSIADPEGVGDEDRLRRTDELLRRWHSAEEADPP